MCAQAEACLQKFGDSTAASKRRAADRVRDMPTCKSEEVKVVDLSVVGAGPYTVGPFTVEESEIEGYVLSTLDWVEEGKDIVITFRRRRMAKNEFEALPEFEGP